MTWPGRGIAYGGPDRWTTVYLADGQPGWTNALSAPISSAPVAVGKTRVLVLGMGESGMVGFGLIGDALPAGYPRPDGTLWTYDVTRGWLPLVEPSHGPQVPMTPAIGAAGMFCWRLQTLLGSSFEVGLIACGYGGSTSADWATGGAQYLNAKNSAVAALAQPRTVLGCILIEQGINDAIAGTQAGWASRWSAIETQLRLDLSNTLAPVYFAQDTLAVSSFTTSPPWTALRAEKATWAAANRILVQKPEGPFVDSNTHLATSAQSVLSQRYMAAWAARPGVTA